MRNLRILLPFLALAAIACGDANVAVNNGATCQSCSADATCNAKPDGTKQCVCKSGFSGDGKTCTKDQVPDPAVCATCAADATCKLSDAGATVCVCKEGFVGTGHTCRKSLDPADCGGCDAQASCQRSSAGSPQCVCDAGVVGDGKTCHVPVDCDDFHGGCHTWAMCELVGGKPRCTCAYGTDGDGVQCLGPAGAYVQLKGNLGITYSKGAANCQAAWSFDVPLMYDGRHYTGHATADVWEMTAVMDVVDASTGEIGVSLSVHAFQNVGACNGDFRFASDPDATLTWADVPDTAPLTWIGESGMWSWASTNGATIHTFSGGLAATFHAP